MTPRFADSERIAALAQGLATAVQGQPHGGTLHPDGTLSAEARVPSSRVPLNLLHMLEAARRGLDDLEYDTAGAEMSIHHHLGGNKHATIRVVLVAQTGEKT